MHRKHHRLLVQHHRLLHENRALRWLLHFRHDSELAALLSRADQNNGFEDVLRFLAWALERQLLILTPPSPDAAERRRRSLPIPF